MNEENKSIKERIKHIGSEAKRIIKFSANTIKEIYSLIISGLFMLLCLVIGLVPVALIVALLIKFFMWLF